MGLGSRKTWTFDSYGLFIVSSTYVHIHVISVYPWKYIDRGAVKSTQIPALHLRKSNLQNVQRRHGSKCAQNERESPFTHKTPFQTLTQQQRRKSSQLLLPPTLLLLLLSLSLPLPLLPLPNPITITATQPFLAFLPPPPFLLQSLHNLTKHRLIAHLYRAVPHRGFQEFSRFVYGEWPLGGDTKVDGRRILQRKGVHSCECCLLYPPIPQFFCKGVVVGFVRKQIGKCTCKSRAEAKLSLTERRNEEETLY
ncbi:hypothetical protein BT69DRAFT_628338 [Atractiella rhizophila]|nr:hypothetical protein BT69DRAFT_628338 [Atractiella rhizophila]